MKECKICGFNGEFIEQEFITYTESELYTDPYDDRDYSPQIDIRVKNELKYFECCPNCHIVYFGALEV